MLALPLTGCGAVITVTVAAATIEATPTLVALANELNGASENAVIPNINHSSFGCS